MYKQKEETMRKQEKSYTKIVNAIKVHIYNNIKQYLIISLLFLIGVVAAVIFINNSEKTQINSELEDNIITFIESLKTEYEIDKGELLRTSIINNIMIAVIFWILGCSIIGIPIIYAIIIYKGFSLAYTISTVILALGTIKGMFFCIISLLLQNIIIIPSLFAMAVSSVNLYKVIVKDKRRENIKVEIARHTIFSVIILILLIASSFVETYLSNTLLEVCITLI
jgi:stage II sporulation protein M